MLIVYTLYTLYCLYSTQELHYHRARWLGVPCMCAYMVLAAYWGLYIAGIRLWTCLASGVGVALLTCWVLLDLSQDTNICIHTHRSNSTQQVRRATPTLEARHVHNRLPAIYRPQ
jgi:hypothetical protein